VESVPAGQASNIDPSSRGTLVTLRRRKTPFPARNADAHRSRDRRHSTTHEDQLPGQKPGAERDERHGERHGLLSLAGQILTSTAITCRALAIAGTVAGLAVSAVLLAGVTRIDVGPIHITVRDAPAGDRQP